MELGDIVIIAGVPLNEQRLVVRGRDLRDGRATLQAAGVRPESTVQLLLRLRGGGASKVTRSERHNFTSVM